MPQGAVGFLNVDSDLTSVTQTCIHDALAQIQFGTGHRRYLARTHRSVARIW